MSPIKRAPSKYSLRRLGRKTVARAVLGASVRASTETEERDGDPRPRRRDRGAAPFPRVHVPRRASVGGDAGAPPRPRFGTSPSRPATDRRRPLPHRLFRRRARPPRVAPGVVARPRRPRRRSRTSRREQTPSFARLLVRFPPTPSRPSRPIPGPPPRRVVTDPEALTSPPASLPSPSPSPVPTRDGSSSASSPPRPPSFSLAAPHFVSRCVGACIDADLPRLRASLVGFIVAGAVNAALDFWNVFLFSFVQNRLVRRLRARLFARILAQEMAFSTSTPAAQSSATHLRLRRRRLRLILGLPQRRRSRRPRPRHSRVPLRPKSRTGTPGVRHHPLCRVRQPTVRRVDD